MRWKLKDRIGQKKIKRKFAILPITIYEETNCIELFKVVYGHSNYKINDGKMTEPNLYTSDYVASNIDIATKSTVSNAKATVSEYYLTL